MRCWAPAFLFAIAIWMRWREKEPGLTGTSRFRIPAGSRVPLRYGDLLLDNQIPLNHSWFFASFQSAQSGFRSCYPEKRHYYTPVYYFVGNICMKTMANVITVEDTEENEEICKKYCGSCPTFKRNNLAQSPPHLLFCARGKTSNPSEVKPINCYCPACELFTKNKLAIGYFCTKG